MVNCFAPQLIQDAIAEISQVVAGTNVWVGAQANLAQPTPENGWEHPGNCSVEQYRDLACRWMDAGVRIIGGCCGTTPAYIAGLSRLRDSMTVEPESGKT